MAFNCQTNPMILYADDVNVKGLVVLLLMKSSCEDIFTSTEAESENRGFQQLHFF